MPDFVHNMVKILYDYEECYPIKPHRNGNIDELRWDILMVKVCVFALR